MIRENTNKAIAVNTVILYGKMIVTTICALLTTRFALKALGVVDFGLYSVVGGIISFMVIFNTIMLSVSNRFIAVAIGKGDDNEINSQFNVCLLIHCAIAIICLLAFPIGDWYITRFVNYDGDINNALMVYRVSVAGSILSFIGVPYNGLLMAKEKFIVFSAVDVISHIIRLIVSALLVFYFSHKLLIYTITIAAMTALPTFLYIIFCSHHYKKIVSLKFVKDKTKYRQIFSFSSWVAIAAIATIAKNQGAALLVNAFFSTIMNTALGVASTVNSYLMLFSQNATQPMQPQITKCYAAGDYSRAKNLLITSTKVSFLMMFLVSVPFLFGGEWLLELWLGEVPPYAFTFLMLLIVDNLIYSLNAGISTIIFASGNIKLFQIIISSFYLLSVIVGFFVLRTGLPAYYLIVAYIAVSIIKFFTIQIVLNRTIRIDNLNLYKQSYLPSMLVVIAVLPLIALKAHVNSLLIIIISMLYTALIIYLLGLSKNERQLVNNYITKLRSRYHV